MAGPFARRRFVVAGAIAAALMLAGCGVKGPLEPPPARDPTPATATKAAISPPPIVTGPPLDARRMRAQKQLGTPTKPEDSFFLDPLL